MARHRVAELRRFLERVREPVHHDAEGVGGPPPAQPVAPPSPPFPPPPSPPPPARPARSGRLDEPAPVLPDESAPGGSAESAPDVSAQTPPAPSDGGRPTPIDDEPGPLDTPPAPRVDSPWLPEELRTPYAATEPGVEPAAAARRWLPNELTGD